MYERIMEYRAVFKCIAGCDGEYDLEQPIYRCPKCGDLLEVAHDLTALRGRSAGEWKHLFDDRYKRTEWPYGSAVWGKKEWVCPGVRDENIVSMDEGGTNLMWAERFGRQLGMDELWIKMCASRTPGRSKISE
jgi:threonine synthase